MSSQVEFFCSPQEEREILGYLTKGTEIRVYRSVEGAIHYWDDFDVAYEQITGEPFYIIIADNSIGDLQWFTEQPRVEGETNRSLVNNYLSRQAWDDRERRNGDRMLNLEKSPVLTYARGKTSAAKTHQNILEAPPGSIGSVSADYERWVKRATSWIRRKATIVHDFRKQSDTIPNPRRLLNTIYAFPDALAEIESGSHPFEIGI